MKASIRGRNFCYDGQIRLLDANLIQNKREGLLLTTWPWRLELAEGSEMMDMTLNLILLANKFKWHFYWTKNQGLPYITLRQTGFDLGHVLFDLFSGGGRKLL